MLLNPFIGYRKPFFVSSIGRKMLSFEDCGSQGLAEDAMKPRARSAL